MKKLFKQIGWLCTLSVLLLAGCQQEELLSIFSNSDIAKVSTRAASTYDYLRNANDIARFRITRNADLEIDDEDAADLLVEIEY